MGNVQGRTRVQDNDGGGKGSRMNSKLERKEIQTDTDTKHFARRKIYAGYRIMGNAREVRSRQFRGKIGER